MVTWLDGGSPVISGSDAQVKPGSYQYTVAGGNGPYSWGVTGTGATIDSGGVLTLGSGACGSILVTCTDCTGRETSQWVRVSNNGKWSGKILYCAVAYPGDGSGCDHYTYSQVIVVRSKYYETSYWGCIFRLPWGVHQLCDLACSPIVTTVSDFVAFYGACPDCDPFVPGVHDCRCWMVYTYEWIC